LNIVVLDGYCLNPGDLDWEGFRTLGNLTVYDRTPAAQIVERQGDAEAMLTNKCIISREVLDALPGLKYIGELATGYNNIDYVYASAKGITVTNIPAYSTESVVQHVFALLFEIVNKTSMHAASVRQGDWVRSRDFCYYEKISELSGKTIGIIGYGRIGRRVAEIAEAFGLNVVAYNKGKSGAAGVKGKLVSSLEELYRVSDIVSLNCPLNAENAGMINKAAIDKMKPGVILINTARGGLINESDLAEALWEGRVAAAGLDVLGKEPPLSDNPLLAAPRTVITPHIAWATTEARRRLMKIAEENLRAYLAGAPINKIN
jgi:glycerate dehydrogenase